MAAIPFDITIPKNKRLVGIGRKVAAEHTDLIMALAIDELGGVLRQGYFDLPSTVEEATEQWFHYADLVLMWLDDGGTRAPCKRQASVLFGTLHTFQKLCDWWLDNCWYRPKISKRL